MPSVSFIIPNYNYGRFIGRAIERCLLQAQSLPDCEVLVIDGGSTDNSMDVVRSFGSAVRSVSEKDAGQSDAVNKGVRLARGDIIGWINSDDYYSDQPFLPQAVELFKQSPKLDMVIGQGVLVDTSGREFRRMAAPQSLDARMLYRLAGNCVFQPTVLFRRQRFLELGGLDTQLHYAMDLDLWMRMLLAGGQVAIIDQTVAYAVVHAQAKTRAQIRASIDDMHRVKMRYRPRLGLSAGDRIAYAMGRARLCLYWAAVTLKLRRVPT
jgi:glycosyltransferase involved in cell wall biosynthesis